MKILGSKWVKGSVKEGNYVEEKRQGIDSRKWMHYVD